MLAAMMECNYDSEAFCLLPDVLFDLVRRGEDEDADCNRDYGAEDGFTVSIDDDVPHGIDDAENQTEDAEDPRGHDPFKVLRCANGKDSLQEGDQAGGDGEVSGEYNKPQLLGRDVQVEFAARDPRFAAGKQDCGEDRVKNAEDDAEDTENFQDFSAAFY